MTISKPSGDELDAKRAAVDASWTKTTLVEGAGDAIGTGQRVLFHCIGRTADAEPFEDSHAICMPRLIRLGQDRPVPGLDRALQSMRVGEKAVVTVTPVGGYGEEGNEHPRVRGAATLTYIVELLEAHAEPDMQELGFDEKMELSADRKRRGNALVGAKQHEWADAEYDAAGQYLAMILHADLTPEQIHAKEEALVAVNLNAAMTRLRRGKANESMDLCHAVLELRPEESKALFRLGQAHAEVANHDEAKAFLTRAEAAATQAGDEERLKAIRLELGRLARSVRESRQREKAFFKKAVNSTPPPPTPTLVQKLLRRHPLGARISLPCSLLIVSLYGMQLWNGEPPGFAEIAVVSGSVMYLTNWILPVASLVDSGVIR